MILLSPCLSLRNHKEGNQLFFGSLSMQKQHIGPELFIFRFALAEKFQSVSVV